ncbi:hypothetical protein [Actinocorallia aurantiaca]|uniref:ATP-binding protein n=1 Tax=Actinocorallia aurantiaca TaxID=46204 RepID=A0ABP6GHS9_9ACTN
MSPLRPSASSPGQSVTGSTAQNVNQIANVAGDLYLGLPHADAAEDVAPVGRPLSQVKNPYELEVHLPVPLDGEQPEETRLPPYVWREHDNELAAVVQAVLEGHSRLAMLVGDSSTGKTRACWEALVPLREQDGWRLWHPYDPTRPEAALSSLRRVGPRTVIWLNESQAYLTDPEAGERIAAALRTLLFDPVRAPVLVLGTLWPQHRKTLTDRADPDPHAQARELLPGRCIIVPSSFPKSTLDALREAASRDPRLAEAVKLARGRQITQYLSGAPSLLARYQTAPPAERALIHAAMDARRLGYGPHLPFALLGRAAPGYLTDHEWDELSDDWLETALAFLTECRDGTASAFSPVRPRPGGGTTVPPGGQSYRLADYLDQMGLRKRYGEIPPEDFWTAVADHAVPDALPSLARAAQQRGLLRTAARLWKNAAAHGNTQAARELVALLSPLHPDDPRPADWASDHASLEDPDATAALLHALREAGAHSQALAFAERAAHHTPLRDPEALARLLRCFRDTDAHSQIATLAERAVHDIPLKPPYAAAAKLLDALHETGARLQSGILAERISAEVSLDDPKALPRLLHALKNAEAGPQTIALAERAARMPLGDLKAAALVLEAFKETGASSQIAALARRAADHASFDDSVTVTALLTTLKATGPASRFRSFAGLAVTQMHLEDPNQVARLLDAFTEMRKTNPRSQFLAQLVAELLEREPAAHVSLEDPQAVARLLDVFEEAGAVGQIDALLKRRPAASVALDSPHAVARLLDNFQKIGDGSQITALAERTASSFPLDDPKSLTVLLDGLRRTDASAKAVKLAERAATDAFPNDPAVLAQLLQSLGGSPVGMAARPRVFTIARRAVRRLPLEDALAVAHLMRALLDAGARDELGLLLERTPAAHVSLHYPEAVAWLLELFREAADPEEEALLLGRDPASHVSLDDPAAIALLLRALRDSGEDTQAGHLAERAARHVSPDQRDLVLLLEALQEAGAHTAIDILAERAVEHFSLEEPNSLADLLDGLRKAGAHEQADRLVPQLPALAMFPLFLEESSTATDFRFGREPDGRPSPPWQWDDLVPPPGTAPGHHTSHSGTAPPPVPLSFSPGDSLNANFTFHGPAVLVSQSTGTVIRDSQNQHADKITNIGTAGREKLDQLLDLIQQSPDLTEQDRQAAVNEVHALVRDLESSEPAARKTGRNHLGRLQEILSRAAGIAVPSAEIIAALTTLLP